MKSVSVHFFDIWMPKKAQNPQFLTLFTWKCASRHNAVYFFHIWTSKSALNVVCVVHFDLEICFAPQRRALFWPLNFQKWSEPPVFETFDLEMCFAPQQGALFWHLNFQKWTEHVVSCTSWLRNLLRTTTSCTFWTSQLPKAVRTCGVLYIFTSKCASRHNSVQFLISHLTTWLRIRRFSEPTFRPQSHNSLQKRSESRLSYLFAHLDLLSSHSFSSLVFSLLGFSSLTLPTSGFPSVHIVGSLTSKFLRWLTIWTIWFTLPLGPLGILRLLVFALASWALTSWGWHLVKSVAKVYMLAIVVCL